MIVHGSYLMQIRSIQSQFSGLITPDRTESTEVLKLLFRLTLNYLELLVVHYYYFQNSAHVEMLLPVEGLDRTFVCGVRPGFCPRHGS